MVNVLADLRGADAGDVSTALRRGRRLEYFTIGWNVIEAAASIWAGVIAGSSALIGFGVDSAIESGSGATLLWRLQDRAGHADHEDVALKLVGWSFVALAAWVAYESVGALLGREPPSPSVAGIAVAALSLLVMPWLARKKRRPRILAREPSTGVRLASDVVVRVSLGDPVGWPGP